MAQLISTVQTVANELRNELRNKLGVTEEQIITSPAKMWSPWPGSSDQVLVLTREETLMASDEVLLCSDGL